MTTTTTSSSRLLPLVGVGVALLAVGADCQQCQQQTQARRLNVDRVSDAALVNGADGHSYFVTANPELQHLRILDLTTQRFVDSPNKFFPLSIPVGPNTHRITIAPDHDGELHGDELYALDNGLQQIFRVRTAGAEKGTLWATDHAPIDVGGAAEDVAAFTSGETTDLYATLVDEGKVRIIRVDDGTPDLVDLGAGAQPARVVADPFGDSIVVSDAALDVVHVLQRDKDTGLITNVVDLDVGGPTGDLSVGVIDIGDGAAPVVLALRADADIAVAIKLHRDGFREDSYTVLGSVELPAYPLVAYVPDNRGSLTICCRDLEGAAIDAGQATDAWAVVGMGDGRLVYLSLAGTPRLFDNDLDGIALGDTDDTDWTPIDDDTARRPVPTLTPADNFGTPPFTPLLDANGALIAIWEGSPPGLSSLSGALQGSTFAATRDVSALDARVGDVAVLFADSVDNPPDGCDAHGTTLTSVTAIAGQRVTLDSFQGTCLISAHGVRLAIGAADAFVVFDGDDNYLGRLGVGDGSTVDLPGATLSLAAASAGPPQHRLSTLRIPIDPHVAVIELPLSDQPQPISVGGGGFGEAGYLPIAITGGLMAIPPVRVGDPVIVTRRMQIATASIEGTTGLNVVFSCDEAESIARLCDDFR